MTIKHNTLVIGVCVVIAAAIPFAFRSPAKKKIFYSSFHMANGWGYNIILNGKLIIHQENIPAIAEKKEFPSKELAEQTARLVIEKIKNNKFPTLTKDEVNKLCGGQQQPVEHE